MVGKPSPFIIRVGNTGADDPRIDLARTWTGFAAHGTQLALDRTTLLAASSHWRTLGRLRRGEELRISRFPLSLAVAFLVTVAILAGLAGLFAR